jgi:hypothetical protein
LGRADHVQKIRDGKQRRDSWKYSFVNKTSENLTNYLQKHYGLSLANIRFLETVRKAIINGVK